MWDQNLSRVEALLRTPPLFMALLSGGSRGVVLSVEYRDGVIRSMFVCVCVFLMIFGSCLDFA